MSVVATEVDREQICRNLADSCKSINEMARLIQLGELSEESGVEMVVTFCHGIEENTKDLSDVERAELYDHCRSHLVPSACAVFDQVIDHEHIPRAYHWICLIGPWGK